jgi:hypothetical protein
MKPNNRRAWIVPFALALIFFAPRFFRSAQQARTLPPMLSSRPIATSAAPDATPSPAGAISSPGATVASAASTVSIAGKWQGAAVLPDRGSCTLKLELRPNDTQNPVKAYSSLACGHTVIDEIAKGHKMTSAEMTKNFMKAANPTSAILSGSIANGTIQLQAEQNFGVNAVSDGCEMASMTLTPFATNQVIADFKESQQGRCQGGQIVLTKIR